MKNTTTLLRCRKSMLLFFNSIQFFFLFLENSRIFTIQLDSFFLQLKDKSSYIKFSKCYSYLPLIHIFSSKKTLRFLKITLIFPKKPIETASNASKNPCSFIPQVFQTCIIPPIKKKKIPPIPQNYPLQKKKENLNGQRDRVVAASFHLAAEKCSSCRWPRTNFPTQ